MTTTEVTINASTYDSTDFYVGLLLTISSCGFIGASFIIKKKALIRQQRYGGLRASSGGCGYLREWIWWAGLLSLGIGEAANFAAYAFAPASLVTPLGALSVLVSAVLASKYLNEKLNLLGKIGCLLCILGSTMIVLHAPKEREVDDLEDLMTKMKEPAFIGYVITVITVTISIIFHFGPKYGKQYIIVYVTLCSAIGSLTVMSCKGLGMAFKETVSGRSNAFTSWLTWFLILSVVVCIAVQMNYLNRSLDLFDTTVVTPIYYVFFTTLVIVASAILFREWNSMSAEDVLGSCSGFLTVITAIFLLNAFREMDIQYGNIRHMLRPKRDTLYSNCSSRRDSRDEQRLIDRIESDLGHGYGTPDMTRTI